MIRPKDRGAGVNASVGYGQVPTAKRKGISPTRGGTEGEWARKNMGRGRTRSLRRSSR